MSLMKPGILFILFFCYMAIFSLYPLNAGIVTNYPYKISEEIKYKEDLNIIFPEITGNLPEERQYALKLIHNRLCGNILAYKKIRLNFTALEFRRNGFDSITDCSNEKRTPAKPIINEPSFLNIRLNPENADASRTDIFIKCDIRYSDSIEMGIHVENRIYNINNNFSLQGNFKQIEKLISETTERIIEALIMDYSYLKIDSVTDGSMLYIDDRYFSQNEEKRIIESGKHKIKIISKNSDLREFDIDLEKGETRTVNTKIESQIVKTNNSLNIITTPDKADVYIDSHYKGQSPVRIENIPDGTYRIRIEKKGFIAKYETIKLNGSEKEINTALEEGNSKDYYFKRTSAYNILYKTFLLGTGASTGAYLYFASEEKYKPQQQTSLYSAIGCAVLTCVFFYFDTKQDDIAIAASLPALKIPDKVNKINGSLIKTGNSDNRASLFIMKKLK